MKHVACLFPLLVAGCLLSHEAPRSSPHSSTGYCAIDGAVVSCEFDAGDVWGAVSPADGSRPLLDGGGDRDGGDDRDGGAPRRPSQDVFDPKEVYVLGLLQQGFCNSAGIAHWSTPDVVSLALDCTCDDGVISPTSGRFIFGFGDWYAFRADGDGAYVPGDPYPSDRFENDDVFRSGGCPSGSTMERLIMAPSGNYIYTCSSSTAWYDQDDQFVYDDGGGTVHAVSAEGTLLVDASLYRIATGKRIDLDEIALGLWRLQAVRNVDDGFLIVLQNEEPNSDNSELWHVGFGGDLTHVCTYPDLPSQTNVGGPGVLDLDGSFYQTGWGLSRTLVVRRTPTGDSEVIFDTSALSFPFEPFDLVTGP